VKKLLVVLHIAADRADAAASNTPDAHGDGMRGRAHHRHGGTNVLQSAVLRVRIAVLEKTVGELIGATSVFEKSSSAALIGPVPADGKDSAQDSVLDDVDVPGASEDAMRKIAIFAASNTFTVSGFDTGAAALDALDVGLDGENDPDPPFDVGFSNAAVRAGAFFDSESDEEPDWFGDEVDVGAEAADDGDEDFTFDDESDPDELDDLDLGGGSEDELNFEDNLANEFFDGDDGAMYMGGFESEDDGFGEGVFSDNSSDDLDFDLHFDADDPGDGDFDFDAGDLPDALDVADEVLPDDSGAPTGGTAEAGSGKEGEVLITADFDAEEDAIEREFLASHKTGGSAAIEKQLHNMFEGREGSEFGIATDAINAADVRIYKPLLIFFAPTTVLP
jgi:hypothetical protein